MARKTEKDANDGGLNRRSTPRRDVNRVVLRERAREDWSVCEPEGCGSRGRDVCARRVPEVWHRRGVAIVAVGEELREEWFREIRFKRGVSLRRKVGVEHERSALNTDENGVKLMNSFGVHWGFKDVASSAKRFEGENKKAEDEIAFVVEKSPPNAIIGTFLRALYKRVGMKTTKHVYVTRHPIANAMALNAMKELNGRVTVGELLENYIKLHETALRDAKALGEDALYPFRMEDFIREPERKAEEVFSFIFNNYDDEDETAKRRAFDSCVAKIESDTGKPLSKTNPNEKYREQWCKMVDKDESARALSASLAEKYQRKLDELGLGYDIATWCDDDNERINYS